MRTSRSRAVRIAAIPGEGEAGVPVAQVCRTHGVSPATASEGKSLRAQEKSPSR